MLTPYLSLRSSPNKALSGVLFFFLVFLFLWIRPSFSFAAQEAKAYADLSPVAKRSWQNILFYSNRWISGDSSLVDSPEFFLSAQGKHDAEAELEAFIEALARDHADVKEEERVLCRFPARVAWIKTFRPDVTVPSANCEQYENWLKISQPTGISIIFSSYFVNNPSSMMGHTFLRIRRAAVDASPLLDQSVNFAATPTHEIPLLYNIDGLTGGFPGNFSMLPYYIKVQEYANAESRDLWEYDLNLNEAETRLVLASLWEIAPQRIDYYFFDENCSAVLLYLVQNARPDLYITEKLGSWVHPSDTLRYLMEEENLVQKIVYRPSSRGRYLAQYDRIRPEERKLIPKLSKAQSLEVAEYQSLDPLRKAMVLDALLAFIEFDESLYGAKKATKYGDLYDQILSARSKLDAAPLTEFPKPEVEAPHLGHKGRRLGLALGRYEEKGEIQLEYRPGQHDLLSPAIGYPPELSIQLGKTRLNFQEDKTARIRSAEFFHIQSFNPTRLGRFPWSWQLQNNFENTDAKRVNLLFSIGQATNLFSRENFAFLFLDNKAKVERGEAYYCPGASAGLRFSILKRFVSFSDIGAERCYGSETEGWEERWSQEFRLSWNDHLESFFEARKYSDAREFTLGFYSYY